MECFTLCLKRLEYRVVKMSPSLLFFFVAFVAPTRSYMFNRSLPRTVACVVFFISNVHVCFKMDDFEMRDECEFTRENCHRRWSTQMGIDVRMGVETG